MNGAKRTVLMVALVLLAGATVWLAASRQNLPAPAVATVLPEPLALPAVQLTDQHGLDFSTADLQGTFSLLFFGFTHCPDICPITLQTLANVDAELRAKGLQPPRVVFVSVDPERDTPARIERYLGNFNANFVGLTGSQLALQPWLAALGVTVQRHQLPGQEFYNVTHNSTVYFVGPQAEWLAIFGAPHDATAIATDYLRVRQLYLTQHTAVAASS